MHNKHSGTNMVAHKVEIHARHDACERGYFKGELTAHCMKRTDVSEEDIIRDILWLKGWLGGCCRCTYSKW